MIHAETHVGVLSVQGNARRQLRLHILRSFSANQALHAPANSKINKDQATTEPQHVHIYHELRTAASHADSRANLIADLAEPRRFSVKQSIYLRGCLQPNDSISRTELLNLILRNQQTDGVDDSSTFVEDMQVLPASLSALQNINHQHPVRCTFLPCGCSVSQGSHVSSTRFGCIQCTTVATRSEGYKIR